MHDIYIHQYNLKNKTDTTNRDGRDNGVRNVDEFILHDNGLYLAMPLKHSKNVKYIKANLLPELGLKITKFSFTNEKTFNNFGAYDYYIDIVDINVEAGIWTVSDLYLDILLWDKQKLEILDTDEFVEANSLGYLSYAHHTDALENLHKFINKMSMFNYDLNGYLASEGIELLWK